MSTARTATEPTTAKGVATRQRLLDVARRVALDTGGHIELAVVAEAAGVVIAQRHAL
jgi:hypothetical protein